MLPPPLLLGSSGVVVCTSWPRLTYVPTKYPQPTLSPPKKKKNSIRIQCLGMLTSPHFSLKDPLNTFFVLPFFLLSPPLRQRDPLSPKLFVAAKSCSAQTSHFPKGHPRPLRLWVYFWLHVTKRSSLRVQSHRRIRAIGLTERTQIPSVSVIPKCLSKLQRFLDSQASAVTIPSRPSPAPSSKKKKMLESFYDVLNDIRAVLLSKFVARGTFFHLVEFCRWPLLWELCVLPFRKRDWWGCSQP